VSTELLPSSNKGGIHRQPGDLKPAFIKKQGKLANNLPIRTYLLYSEGLAFYQSFRDSFVVPLIVSQQVMFIAFYTLGFPQVLTALLGPL
jgi:hypothetical protein